MKKQIIFIFLLLMILAGNILLYIEIKRELGIWLILFGTAIALLVDPILDMLKTKQ